MAAEAPLTRSTSVTIEDVFLPDGCPAPAPAPAPYMESVRTGPLDINMFMEVERYACKDTREDCGTLLDRIVSLRGVTAATHIMTQGGWVIIDHEYRTSHQVQQLCRHIEYIFKAAASSTAYAIERVHLYDMTSPDATNLKHALRTQSPHQYIHITPITMSTQSPLPFEARLGTDITPEEMTTNPLLAACSHLPEQHIPPRDGGGIGSSSEDDPDEVIVTQDPIIAPSRPASPQSFDSSSYVSPRPTIPADDDRAPPPIRTTPNRRRRLSLEDLPTPDEHTACPSVEASPYQPNTRRRIDYTETP